MKLTKAQETTLKELKEDIMKAHNRGDAERYEYKIWEVKESGIERLPHIFLIAEVGMKGDENTLASIYCREHRHIMIGPKGGCTLLNAGRFVEDKEGKIKRVERKSKTTGYWACVHSTTYY